MRPLFAIAPLAFVLALLSPSPAELSTSFASFKAMFANGDKAVTERKAVLVETPVAHLNH
ncbi:MAG: hypothetical protein KGN37_04450 [Burkholderiales bacterium]|nr:hypothetical protein [Burkholderiales bacterium]HET8694719.1 hypothetical protein [Aquabacterium sp.]